MAKKFPDLNKDGKVTQADILKGRGVYNEGGSLMMPPEREVPVDTYDNISTPEEIEQTENMVPDAQMEEEYVEYVGEEMLSSDEQEYLFKALDNDPKLEDILNKVILKATEFSGSGEVEGPGTGVSDSIPARLSDGEFVFTRKATDQIGPENLQKIMDDAERAYDGGLMAKADGGVVPPLPYSMTDRVPTEVASEDTKRQMIYSSQMPSLMNR